LAYNNNFSFEGKLGADPALKYTNSGKAVINFTIAINRGKNKPPAWVKVKAWEEIAMDIVNRFGKGDTVTVRQSYPDAETYTDRNGRPQNQLVFVVTEIAGENEDAGGPRPDDDVPY
jgi:single-strand DNA-binding protein